MSQHLCSTKANGEPVTVVLGYDQPLDCVHCTVLDDLGRIVYSSFADEPNRRTQNIRSFKPVLKKLGVEVPERMFFEVAKDQLRKNECRFEVYKIESPGF